MDTTDPDIEFDSDGVCSHCHRFDVMFRAQVQAAKEGRRERDLHGLVSDIKSRQRGREYDCVIGVSGGVDSTYLLLKAVDLGLRPLAVHFDSGWNSELSVNNIEAATSTLGVDLKTDVVDWREMRDLQLSFLRAGVPNCDIPTDHAFPAVALKSAVQHHAPFILIGSNLATESVLPRSWGHNASDLRYLRAVQRRHGSVKLRTYPALGLVRKEVWFRGVRRVKQLAPLDYLPYDKDAAKREIADRLQWRDYGGKHHESVFTRWFQGFYLPQRFGFDKRLAHLSSLILAGQLSRDEAMHELTHEPTYDTVQQVRDTHFIAKKLGISYDELMRLVEAPLSEMGHYPTNDRFYELGFKVRDAGRSLSRARPTTRTR